MRNILRYLKPTTERLFPPYFFICMVILSLSSLLLITNPSTYGSPPLLLEQEMTYSEEQRAINQNIQSAMYDRQSPANTLQTSGTPPKAITGAASSITHNSVVLNGVVNASGLATTAWFQYRTITGLAKSTFSTQKVIGTTDTEISIRVIRLLPGTTYYYRLVAENNVGITHGEELSFTTIDMKPHLTLDITPPTGSITINDGAHYTNSPTVILNLSATDNIGVTGYYISADPMVPSATTPGWISLSPFAAYTEEFDKDVPYTLRNDDGTYTVYVWYKDIAGNVSDAASNSIVLDTTPPSVTITIPTSDAAYITANDTISISGIASDDISGVTSVIWTTDRDITEKKTVNWTIPNINLLEGDNVITIEATDGAGNTESKTITITHLPGVSPDVVTKPETNITLHSATLHGSVNTKELPTTAWFQYGTVSRSYSDASSVRNIDSSRDDISVSSRLSGLKAGIVYYYRLAAQNSAGITYGNEMSFTTALPKGNIYGNVVSFISGRPVKYAKVRLKGRYAGKKTFRVIHTNKKGAFTFKDLSPDTYDISVLKTGMKSATQTIELHQGEERKIDIKLDSSLPSE